MLRVPRRKPYLRLRLPSVAGIQQTVEYYLDLIARRGVAAASSNGASGSHPFKAC